ncbi:MAG: hypothetical protein ACOZAO_05600 [Patescibacteria group bacterium]
MSADISKDINSIKSQIDAIEKSLAKVKALLKTVDEATKVSYREVPGVMGVFDGFNMITEDGQKYEVNPNYAAKSMLAYGDTLKMIEDGGKKLFKQVEKIDRKILEGVVSKKDGQWHVLTDAGSYVISEAAASFNDLEVNNKVRVEVPANNLKAPFATLDSVVKDEKSVAPSKTATDAPSLAESPTPNSTPVPPQPQEVIAPAGDIPLEPSTPAPQPVAPPPPSVDVVKPPVPPVPPVEALEMPTEPLTPKTQPTSSTQIEPELKEFDPSVINDEDLR